MLTDNLVEFWSLNGSRIGRNGTELTSGDGLDHFVAGKIGQAWDAGGVANRVLRNLDAPVALAGALTISYWIFVPADYSQNVKRHFVIRVGTASKAHASWSNLSAEYQEFTFGVPGAGAEVDCSGYVRPGEWNHLCFACDDKSTVLCVNGTLLEQEGMVGTPVSGPYALWIGGHNTAAHNEPIDSWGFWSRRLSPAELAELYAAGAGWEPSAADATPDAVAFDALTGAARNTQYTSDAVEITGMDAGTAISVADCEYSIDGGVFTAAAGTIDPGQSVRLRRNSSPNYATTVSATLTVGTVSAQWDITTGNAPALGRPVTIGTLCAAVAVGQVTQEKPIGQI